MKTLLATTSLLCVLGLPAAAVNTGGQLEAQSSGEDALTGQLHTATISTVSLEESLLFYRDGMGMRVRGPIEVDTKIKRRQRKLWSIPRHIDWDLYLLDRPAAPGSVQIRLLVLDTPTPAIHQSWSPLQLGPFSLGFPESDMKKVDAHIRDLGFGSRNPMASYQLKRADGSQYTINETIFNCPDFLHCVGIYRGAGPLGAIDDDTGRGGPAYSAMILDDADKDLAFYTEVLEWEVRRDTVWQSGPHGALDVPEGTEYRFILAYAKGAQSGHLLFLDFLYPDTTKNTVPPRVPNRGLGMWSFPVYDMDKVIANIKRANMPIVHGPVGYTSPSLGQHRAITVLAPNGFLIELFEERKGS